MTLWKEKNFETYLLKKIPMLNIFLKEKRMRKKVKMMTRKKKKWKLK
jgi:hypothetical protein